MGKMVTLYVEKFSTRPRPGWPIAPPRCGAAGLQQHAPAEFLVADGPVSPPHRGFVAIVGEHKALPRFLALIRAGGQAEILSVLGQQRIGRTQRGGRRARPRVRPRQRDHRRLDRVALIGNE
jgi:hypothetical protein